jgi:hypothetical protein
MNISRVWLRGWVEPSFLFGCGDGMDDILTPLTLPFMGPPVILLFTLSSSSVRPTPATHPGGCRAPRPRLTQHWPWRSLRLPLRCPVSTTMALPLSFGYRARLEPRPCAAPLRPPRPPRASPLCFLAPAATCPSSPAPAAPGDERGCTQTRRR